DVAYLDAALLGGAHDLGATWSYGGVAFSSFDPIWFINMSAVSEDPSWQNVAKADFFDRLTAGTYGDGGGGCDAAFPGSTHDYIARHKCGRSGVHINLRAWDMQFMPLAASQIGNSDSAPADGISQQDAFINECI